MVCHSYIDSVFRCCPCAWDLGACRGLTTARTTVDHPAQCRDCLSYCFVVVEGIRPPPLPMFNPNISATVSRRPDTCAVG